MLGSAVKITCLQITSSLTLSMQWVADSHKCMLSCIISYILVVQGTVGARQSLRVMTYHKNPLKFKLFGWQSYWFCFMRRISTCWLIQIFCTSHYSVYLTHISSYQGQILFTRRVVKQWNRLLREAAETPSLEILETQLSVTLSWWNVEAGLLWAGVEPSREPFLPQSL